jgi:hypothetical protein
MTMRDEREYNCGRAKVAETSEWLAVHDSHGMIDTQLSPRQPPRGTYTLYTMICPCGAQHVFIKREE